MNLFQRRARSDEPFNVHESTPQGLYFPATLLQVILRISRVTRRLNKRTFLAWLFVPACGFFLNVGCDSAPEATTEAKAPEKKTGRGVVHLTAEEIQRGGIEVKPVTRVDFRTIRDFPGTVLPNQHAVAEITTLVRGRVVDVYVDLGQEVKGGALLAILYSSELGLAQSAYLKAVAHLYVAERAFSRAQSLLEEKVIGLAEMQRREGEMISVRAEKRESQDRLRLLGMSSEQIARLDREQTIQSHVPIVAPFDGRVIVRNLTKGEVVETTEKLFIVADLSEVWVIANIPEKDIPYIHQDQLKNGQMVEVIVTTYPDQVFNGKITYVGDVLDPATRTMRLRLELPNPHRKLKPEMYATIRIYSDPERNVLVVPESAIQRDRDRRFVFVQRDPQSFEVRDVKLGQSSGDIVKILDGLTEGESIVTQGAFVLKSELLGEQI
jgi:cobalt-zinc-cadmium efflux system membrane fusion protein